MSTPSIAFTGAILAGGRSSRMGRDKAFLPLEGITLVARQAALLRTLGARELLISGRASVDYGISDTRVVLDPVPDSGPLAGLTGILEASSTAWILILAVDLPHLTPAYLQALLSSAADGTGTVPQGPKGFEPLAALYPRAALPCAQRRLANRTLSLQDFVRDLIDMGLAKPLPIKAEHVHLFANWNSPGDLGA